MSCCFAHKTYCVLDVAVAKVHTIESGRFLSPLSKKRVHVANVPVFESFSPIHTKTLTISIPAEHAPYNV